jgi:hypothetical protein
MMTGRFGIHTGAIGTAEPTAICGWKARSGFQDLLSFDTLPEYLNRQAGMHTATSAAWGPAFPVHLLRGFRKSTTQARAA